MRVRTSWEIVVGLPATALSATLLPFAISTSGAAQGVANPAGQPANPQSCTAPGHNGPGGSATPPAPGVIVPVDGAVIPSTDNPVSDPPGNTPGSDDDAGTPITTPPTGDPTPPVLGEVLPESAGPVPPPPTGLPNSGSGGLAATNPDADPTAATLILIATAIAIASASALHFVQRRLNGPNAS